MLVGSLHVLEIDVMIRLERCDAEFLVGGQEVLLLLDLLFGEHFLISEDNGAVDLFEAD